MGPPVRVVCLDCLHSIEVSVSGSASQPDSCPYCGSYLDPFRPGIQSRAEFEVSSLPTLDLSEASTLRSDNEFPGGVNRTVGRFQIRMILGEGGYGQVFRAFDPHLEREVALKVLKPNRLGEKAMQRFYREARAAARLDHPNIVGLHDAGRDEGRCWIAYQLVSGRTLSAVRDHNRLTVLESIRIVRDLALGLHHAHSRGVFHRDLKPANIMIDDAGRPRLTDFGLARRDDVQSDLTTEGTVLGTPQYMSPEAAAGRAHEADARSDVYSLGVILYELLCGRRPCDLPSGAPLWRTTLQSSPRTPRSVDRAVPPTLDRICMKALAFDPADRYPNAELLAEALTDEILKYRPVRSIRPIRSLGLIGRIARPRLPRLGKVAAAATLGLVAIAAWFGSARFHARPPVADDRPPLVAASPAPNFAGSERSEHEGPTAPEAQPAPAKEVEPRDPASTPAPDKPTAPALPPAPSTSFVGNASPDSHVYHVAYKGCSSRILRRVSFATADEARAAGFIPCRSCHPERFLTTGSPASAP